ncbi:GPW/gp25 family protein [Pedobacter sp. MC2016-15]|uniref:GPW/gp25 family protein n=1 Tax=Pedobacter sp. MC2016-15 TaxID=2994473 RepID=UPI002248066C|nr:GPW/gp25 family protein [Pedobacter sp. MC2016-15]MCX2478059.1 GPW/gp25 family protein [Pedobacter sp. MC2016-15]
MSSLLYKKPFRLGRVFSGSDLEPSELGKSISQHIELMIFTRFGEHRFDRDFGCEIWDLDFELIVSETIWEEKFKRSLLSSLVYNEPRLNEVELNVELAEVEKTYQGMHYRGLKKKVSISLKGKIVLTGENYYFNTSIFLSPLCG